MNLRRLAIALAFGLILSGLATYALQKRLQRGGLPQVDTQRYLAASHALEAGQPLKAEDLEPLQWPSTVPLAGAFKNQNDLLGRILLYPVNPGQPITDKLVAAAGAGVGLASRIPEGMRALAMRSDEIVGVAGFLQPDSHVDVLATMHMDDDPAPVTFTVLQNAQVIAAGHQVEPDPEGIPATVTVVTLLLTPEDAERAVLASLQGSIHFVLRNNLDKAISKDAPVKLVELEGKKTPDPARPKPAQFIRPVLPARPELVVETFAGDKKTSEAFPAGQP
jgi:pilus assembly protein CpaB